MGMEIAKILGDISEDEVKMGHPMLSAIAVGVSGEPGPGFFGFAKDLGRFKGEGFKGEGKDAEHRFWEAEKKAVYDKWSKKFKKR